MITGLVTARLEAMIPLTIHGLGGKQQDIEARIDTGFSGALTVQPMVIAGLGLAWRSQAQATLANGSVIQLDTYYATVLWDGAIRNIVIAAADTNPLLGTGLLAGHEVRIQMVMGGSVIIEALP